MTSRRENRLGFDTRGPLREVVALTLDGSQELVIPAMKAKEALKARSQADPSNASEVIRDTVRAWLRSA